jgi:hypothetical protein
MTIREIISGIRVVIDKGYPSDDSPFTNQYFYHLMKIYRGVLLNEKLKDPSYNYILNLQTLDCIKLVSTEKNECCEKLPSGCKWLKSVNKIPNTINDLIYKVYNDRGDTYTRVSSESSKSFKRYGFGETNDYKYLIKNGVLFVPDLSSPQWVKIEGLFYDDEAVKSTCGSICDLLDTEFPLDDRLLDKMYSMIYDKILKTYPYFTKDNINDTAQEEQTTKQGK